MFFLGVLIFIDFYLQLQLSCRADLLRVLKALDKTLETRTFLVGEAVTLADMAVSMAALLPFKYVSVHLHLTSLLYTF